MRHSIILLPPGGRMSRSDKKGACRKSVTHVKVSQFPQKKVDWNTHSFPRAGRRSWFGRWKVKRRTLALVLITGIQAVPLFGEAWSYYIPGNSIRDIAVNGDSVWCVTIARAPVRERIPGRSSSGGTVRIRSMREPPSSSTCTPGAAWTSTCTTSGDRRSVRSEIGRIGGPQRVR